MDLAHLCNFVGEHSNNHLKLFSLLLSVLTLDPQNQRPYKKEILMELIEAVFSLCMDPLLYVICVSVCARLCSFIVWV